LVYCLAPMLHQTLHVVFGSVRDRFFVPNKTLSFVSVSERSVSPLHAHDMQKENLANKQHHGCPNHPPPPSRSGSIT
jgi:hypothetical protein